MTTQRLLNARAAMGLPTNKNIKTVESDDWAEKFWSDNWPADDEAYDTETNDRANRLWREAKTYELRAHLRLIYPRLFADAPEDWGGFADLDQPT